MMNHQPIIVEDSGQPVEDSTASAVRTIDIEIQALSAMRNAILAEGANGSISQAVEMIAEAKGRLVVTGMGKSGHIGRKIAATMRSTGTPAVFLHPGEASHGDMGLIDPADIVLALTWSGETSELSDIFHYCQNFGIKLIATTSKPDSTAAKTADICLKLPQVREACPLELAPTSSSTMQLVLGDILAIALIEARGFTPTEFRNFHPGGTLGSRLSTVGDLMGTGDAIPRVPPDTTPIAAALEMSGKRYGCTAVVDERGALVGAYTDGDLRRCIAINSMDEELSQHMSHKPVSVSPDMLATDALRIMNESAVMVLFVQDQGQLIGIVHMHDIVGTGVT